MKKIIEKSTKFLAMTILAIALSVAISAIPHTAISHTSLAYTIPDQLKPVGEPFNIGSDLDPSKGGSTASPTSGTIVLLQILAGGLLYFAAPVAVIIIAMAGFNMVIRGAETEKVEESKRSLTWAIVGLLLIIFSYSLVRIIIGTALGIASS